MRKIELVKSKWGLALAACAQLSQLRFIHLSLSLFIHVCSFFTHYMFTNIVSSLLMATGICSHLGIKPTLNRAEIFPYLMMFLGVENIIVLIKVSIKIY